MERLGALDIAVNNAGVNFNNAAEDTPESEWDTTFNLNTKGLFLCCQVAPLCTLMLRRNCRDAVNIYPDSPILDLHLMSCVFIPLCPFQLLRKQALEDRQYK